MKTKKIEQSGLTKKIGFGKSFYAIVCGLAIALAGGSYFLVSAGNIEVQTDIDNAVQTIKEIIVTSDGTSSGTPYFHFNKDLNGGAIFNAIQPGTMVQDLGLDASNNLVIVTPPSSLDDGDRVIVGNDVYKTGNVSIGSSYFPGKLNVISSDLNKPELYIKQSSTSAANIHFVDENNNTWAMGAMPAAVPYFYLGVNGGQNILYINNNYTAGINSNFTISGSLTLNQTDIDGVDMITAILFNQLSDKNLKENITPIKTPLDKIYALNGYTFDWKSDGRHDLGLIAQEVEQVLPELVHIDTSGHRTLQYSNMVALLIEGIKELGNKIEGLYVKYLDQQNQIKNLELRIEKLENK